MFGPEKSNKRFSLFPLILDQKALQEDFLEDFLEDPAYEPEQGELSSLKKLHFHSYKKSMAATGEKNELLSFSFPTKLRRIVESDEVKSIIWNYNGDRIIINEACFQRQILNRTGVLEIFETNSTKSFIRQLYPCGFSKIHKDITCHHSQAEKNRARGRILVTKIKIYLK